MNPITKHTPNSNKVVNSRVSLITQRQFVWAILEVGAGEVLPNKQEEVDSFIRRTFACTPSSALPSESKLLHRG